MKVVEITTTLDKKEYLVILENNSKFRASADVILKFKIAPGLELSGDDIANIKNNSKDDRAFNAALRLITGRRKTEFEIRAYLKKKELNQERIEEIVNRLLDLNLLDDSKYIESFIHDQNLKSPISRTKLIYKLKAKGISANLIDEYFSSHEDNQLDNLKKLIEIKRRQTKYKDNQKLMAYLVRNGFNYSDIKSII